MIQPYCPVLYKVPELASEEQLYYVFVLLLLSIGKYVILIGRLPYVSMQCSIDFRSHEMALKRYKYVVELFVIEVLQTFYTSSLAS